MGTALIYLVVVLGVAAVFFLGASAVFGRGEELAPLPSGTTPTWLPDRDVRGDHVRAVRFQQALRGYKMAEVDWALERLAGELDQVIAERDELRRRLSEVDPSGAVAESSRSASVDSALGENEEADPAEPKSELKSEPKPTGAEPTGSSAASTEPTKAEATGTEPSDPELTGAEPASTEPASTESASAESTDGAAERDGFTGGPVAERVRQADAGR